jgi:integrase
MSIRMAKLRRDPQSGSWLSRKEVPRALRDAYSAIYKRRYEEIFRAPPDCPAARARVLFSEWQSEIDSRFAALRAKARGQGRDLTQRDAHALAGAWYRWFTSQHEESPGHPDRWRGEFDGWDAAVFQSESYDDETRSIDPSEALGPSGDLHAPLARAARIDEFLISKNEALSPSATTMFLDRVLWVYPKAVELLERRAKGDYSKDQHLETLPEYQPRPTAQRGAFAPPKGPTAPKGIITALQRGGSATTLFEAHIVAAKLAPETILRRRPVFTELDALLNGRPFETLTDDEAQGWLTAMIGRRSPSTVRSVYLVALNALGRWAVRQKLISRNPFEQATVVVPKKVMNRETRAFTTDEVQRVLGAASSIKDTKRTTQAVRRWVPWLCAYTGARAGEMTQLRGKDVIERDGIPAIRITPEAGTVKTKQARLVPIHEHLIARGLLEFVRARGAGPLFYEPKGPSDASAPLKRSRPVYVRVSLGEWVRSIGITDPEVSPTHGWRHTFKQIADRCGISERMSDTITGHAPQSEGRKYGAPTLEDMAEAMKRFPRYKVP